MLLLRHHLFEICQPVVMGVVNVTPDSFAVHCSSMDEAGVVTESERLVNQGADWLDIGACSTRPGGEPVPEQEEIARLDMALAIIREKYPNIIVSVDTFRSKVAELVLEKHGVDIINDVSGLGDEAMMDVLSRAHVPYIITYPGATCDMMVEWLSRQLNRLHRVGVTDVIVDPGLGFGKSLEQNYQCLRSLNLLHQLDCPVLVGLSRKSMIYNALECSPEDALNGTTAAHMLALMQGANILRVHDVKAAKEAIKIWETGNRK